MEKISIFFAKDFSNLLNNMSEFISALYESSRRSTNEGNVLNDGVTRTFGREVILIGDFNTFINKYGKKPKTMRIIEAIIPNNMENVSEANNKIIFEDSDTIIKTATITSGYYPDLSSIMTAVKTALDTASIETWTLTDLGIPNNISPNVIRLASTGPFKILTQDESFIFDLIDFRGLNIDATSLPYETDLQYVTSKVRSIMIRCSFAQGIDSIYQVNTYNTDTSSLTTNIYDKYNPLMIITKNNTTDINNMIYQKNVRMNPVAINGKIEELQLVFVLTDQYGIPIKLYGEWGFVMEWGFEEKNKALTTLVNII